MSFSSIHASHKRETSGARGVAGDAGGGTDERAPEGETNAAKNTVPSPEDNEKLTSEAVMRKGVGSKKDACDRTNGGDGRGRGVAPATGRTSSRQNVTGGLW